MANISDPAPHAAAVTPSDVNDLPNSADALYVGGTGDLKATLIGGDVVTFAALPVGWHPIRVRKVWSTGTTATNIVAVRQ